jgi:hypothetical protein
MGEAAKVADHPAVLVIPEPVAEREAADLAAELQLSHRPAAHVVPLRRRIVEILTVDPLGLCKPQHVHDPGANRLDHHLCPFALEKAEHPEVAVTFRRLRPELTGDFHHRFDTQAVDVDRTDALPRGRERLEGLRSIQVVVNLAEHIHRVAHGLLAV